MTPQEMRDLKTATESLTKWESSGKAFGHYQIIEGKATHTKGADKIYEFYCLMRILEDLMTNYTVTLVPGTRKNKIFPQSPGAKNGWAYFVIENKTNPNNKYQVCYGTEIKLSTSPETTIAPDISFQHHAATDDPDETMVELIMDAKFKFDDSDTLPINQIHAFIQAVKALKVLNADSIHLDLDTLIKLKGNCLLTNGQALKKQEKYCQNEKIKQVERFDIGSAFNVIG